MDESELIKKETTIDDEREHVETVEYCVLACPGSAHRTGVADAPGHFCNMHVHRSVDMTLKPQAVASADVGRFA